MDTTPIRLGIIGAGNAGTLVVRETKDDPRFSIEGIFDEDSDRASEFAGGFGISPHKISPNLDSFLGNSYDLVYVGVPSGFHRDVGLQVMGAGHNLVMEKPIEITIGAADELIAASAEQGVQMYVISQYRYKPDVQKVRGILEEGLLGDITKVSIGVNWLRDEEYYRRSGWRGTWAVDGGGALTNQGIHAVDVMHCLGGDLAQITGADGMIYGHRETKGFRGIEVEDWVTAKGVFTNGAEANIFATTCGQIGDPTTIHVQGNNGEIQMLDYRIQWGYHYVDGARVLIRSLEEASDAPKAEGPMSAKGHGEQLYRIGMAIRGEGTAMVEPKEALRALETVQGVYRCIETGQPVALPIKDRTYKVDPQLMKEILLQGVG